MTVSPRRTRGAWLKPPQTKRFKGTNKMNAKTLEAVTRHGETLLRAFPNAIEKNPVALCKKLRRIETAVAKPILDYTNGENGVTQDALDHACNMAQIRCGNLLGLDKHGIAMDGLFVNRDPRGYALKIDSDSDWFKDWQGAQYAAKLPALHTDMGGYGILAPDLNQ